MSKKCIQCGAELEDNALFCDECGVRQATPKSTASSTERQTSQANVKILSTDRIVQCGKAFVGRRSIHAGTQTENLTPDMLKNSATGIASFVLGIIALCTFGIFVIPAILSIIMGIAAIKDPSVKHGIPVAGLVMSVTSFVLLIIITNT